MFPNAHITAIDTSEQYLGMLRKQLYQKRCKDRVTVLNTSMFEMDFQSTTFDLIWAKGSIYIAGFQKGLKLDEYYNPLERNLKEMEEMYHNIPVALDVVNMIKQEIKLYYDHFDDYSYVFYGMKKINTFIIF